MAAERSIGTFSGAAGIPMITDCVLAELEKLGSKYRVALRYSSAVRGMLLALANES
jgi:rRNA-processing protein FCF1